MRLQTVFVRTLLPLSLLAWAIACGGKTAGTGATAEDANDAGEECVEIDVSTYDRSCNDVSDCTEIPTGAVCDGSCECGGTPVNVSGEARYKQAVSGIVFDACHCAEGASLACINNQCMFTGAP